MTRTINFISAAAIFVAALVSQKALANNPFSPTRVEAESWTAKEGPLYATTSTDPEGGNQMVVGIANGSWMDYTINPSSGNYSFTFRIATPQAAAQFKIMSGGSELKTVNITSTGDWATWENVTVINVPLSAGSQTIRIISTSNETCNFNWMEFELGTNQSPTANPGQAASYNLPLTSITLSGSGTDPDPDGTIASYAWTKVSGPAVTITSPSSATTTVTGISAPGVRVFRLTVTDNQNATGYADVTITINPDPAPTVSGGGNQTITMPTSEVTLTGSATANNNGTIASHTWTQQSGTAASITSPSSLTTTITGLTSTGARTFRLTATDNEGHTAFNDVIITVQSTGGTANYWNLNASSSVYYLNGNVGIGTDDPQYKLAVNGDIAAKRVRVTQLGWSDYVFEKTYRLPSLAEVEKYIAQHKHLPDLPSAAEVENEGVELGGNQALLLKKIEELTLYAIDANKKMEQQQEEIKALQTQLKKIQLQLAGNKFTGNAIRRN